MAAGKAVLDAGATIQEGSIVTCLTRNGSEFAIRVSGLGDRWFTGPEDTLDTLYFPGSRRRRLPRLGDSAILEAYGSAGSSPSPLRPCSNWWARERRLRRGSRHERGTAGDRGREQPEHADPELELQRAFPSASTSARSSRRDRASDHDGGDAQEGRNRDGRRSGRCGPRCRASPRPSRPSARLVRNHADSLTLSPTRWDGPAMPITRLSVQTVRILEENPPARIHSAFTSAVNLQAGERLITCSTGAISAPHGVEMSPGDLAQLQRMHGTTPVEVLDWQPHERAIVSRSGKLVISSAPHTTVFDTALPACYGCQHHRLRRPPRRAPCTHASAHGPRQRMAGPHR